MKRMKIVKQEVQEAKQDDDQDYGTANLEANIEVEQDAGTASLEEVQEVKQDEGTANLEASLEAKREEVNDIIDQLDTSAIDPEAEARLASVLEEIAELEAKVGRQPEDLQDMHGGNGM